MLYDELQQIEPMQNSIDQTLDYVETQQQELSVALDDYERQLSGSQAQDFSASSTGRTRTAAQEREEAYKTAEEVHVQLNDMASSLGTMIAELNSLAGPGNRIDESSLADGTISSGSASNEDPIVQIAGILNAHLGSLNWIGEITQELGVKVNELESRVSNTKVEFGLEPNLNHYRQIEFNSDEFNPNLSATVGPSGASLNSGFGSRIPSGLLSHPRR
jgi:nuclear pore complex protein Nup62